MYEIDLIYYILNYIFEIDLIYYTMNCILL